MQQEASYCEPCKWHWPWLLPILVMSREIQISGLWAEINATLGHGCESGPLITSDGVMLISTPQIMRRFKLRLRTLIRREIQGGPPPYPPTGKKSGKYLTLTIFFHTLSINDTWFMVIYNETSSGRISLGMDHFHIVCVDIIFYLVLLILLSDKWLWVPVCEILRKN